MVFEETVASTAEVHVEGRNFYPPMVRDIENATSSIHINQFGFRPGVVGERFAEALLAKSREGVPVRLIVDRQGSDPDLQRIGAPSLRSKWPGTGLSRDGA